MPLGLGPGLGDPPIGELECGYPFDISSIAPDGYTEKCSAVTTEAYFYNFNKMKQKMK